MYMTSWKNLRSQIKRAKAKRSEFEKGCEEYVKLTTEINTMDNYSQILLMVRKDNKVCTIQIGRHDISFTFLLDRWTIVDEFGKVIARLDVDDTWYLSNIFIEKGDKVNYSDVENIVIKYLKGWRAL